MAAAQGHARDLARLPLTGGAMAPQGTLRHARNDVFSSFVYNTGIHFHTAIDESAATSTYTTGGEGPELSAFSARQALRPGTGYWCSSGFVRPDEVVTWTGRLHKRRSGIKISWAYAPGEVRVRSTADGMHWDEVVGWHKPQRDEVSFEEDMVFDRPRNVMQVKVEMRGKRMWPYFGINQA
eukprot:CAMPEP_0168367274 /NCGR_PEP_ID=MMETSP0228-20121227/5655_1 /TAXON_ID=133427 /ORGANISM="Protoceratium reticulatum, Strain CCCM 535 (=CCMP 1889)" /LENGTH=180 /DNA_ID=CAMNT_0008380093 /DNA_START=24 /DNA_END=563 /DNA_ORIENTATION=-